MGHGFRVELESSQVEVDCVAEAVSVPETLGGAFEVLEDGVETLLPGVGHLGHDGIDDASQVGLEHPSYPLDGLAARGKSPAGRAQL